MTKPMLAKPMPPPGHVSVREYADFHCLNFVAVRSAVSCNRLEYRRVGNRIFVKLDADIMPPKKPWQSNYRRILRAGIC